MYSELIIFISQFSKIVAGKKLMSHPVYWEYAKSLYPVYDSIKDIMWHLRRGYTEQKLCIVCNGKLKELHQDCCSYTCSNQYRIVSGANVAIQEKARKTCIEKYGVDCPAKSNTVKEKTKSTLLSRYGGLVSNNTREAARKRSADLNVKGRATLYKKYGVTNPGQLPDHVEKVKLTNYEKYGNENYYLSDAGREHTLNRQLEKWTKFSLDTPLEISSIAPGTTLHPNYRITYSCSVCNTELTAPSETFKWRIQNYQSACTKCLSLDTGSFKETQVFNFVADNYSGKIIRNDRTVLDGKEIDILLPDIKLGIEFAGLYWHSDHIILDKNYHRNKMELANLNGYRLLTIFEDEWDYRQDIVKAKLLNAIGLSTTKIFARNTTVKIVNTDIAKKFINSTHIQGYTPSSVKLGLVDNSGRLVACMTFSSLSRAKGAKPQAGHWEVSRYSTSILVTGGFSKLFSYFLKMYNPKYVLSYSDLRWGVGNAYAHSGFIKVKDTAPGYWYHRGGNRSHRFSLRKNKNDDASKTEYELRCSEGYRRIWDCGNAKWEWTRP